MSQGRCYAVYHNEAASGASVSRHVVQSSLEIYAGDDFDARYVLLMKGVHHDVDSLSIWQISNAFILSASYTHSCQSPRYVLSRSHSGSFCRTCNWDEARSVAVATATLINGSFARMDSSHLRHSQRTHRLLVETVSSDCQRITNKYCFPQALFLSWSHSGLRIE